MTILTDEQIEAFRTDGFVVVDDLIESNELAELRTEAEEMVRTISDLVRENNPRERLLEGQFRQGLVDGYSIEWEWENPQTETLKMVRYFYRRWPKLNQLAWDWRVIGAIEQLSGADDIVMHSDKFNLKAPGEGTEFYWHQDLPFFNIEDGALEVDRCLTAIVFLDDATADNGCIVVAPGSHLLGLQELGEGTYNALHPRKADNFDEVGVAVPMTAGSMLILDPLVMHRSGPNRSTTNRRNVLYSYQPRPADGELYDEQGLPGRLRGTPFV